MRRVSARPWILLAFTVFSISSAPKAHAQAWVPDVGDGTLALSMQYTRVMKHLLSENVDQRVDPTSGYVLGPGNQAYYGDIIAMTNAISGEYVPLRRLAVSGEMAFIASRYDGRLPESPLDDGSYHADLQDMVLGARYMLPIRTLALTPSVDVRFPLTDYNRFGHVAAGTGLTSVSLGLNAGRSLDPIAPLVYVFLSYARVIVEDSDGYSLDGNHFACGAGMFFTRALSAQGNFEYSDTMDGMDWQWANADDIHRNVVARALFRRVGLSAGYSLTHRLGLAMSWQSTISGANVHATHSGALGVSCGFWRKRPL